MMATLASGISCLCSTSMAQSQTQLLFKDTFNVTQASDDINSEYTTRQTGVLAPLTYTSTADGATIFSQVGQSDAPNQLKLMGVSATVSVSPDHNFTEGSTFSIDFDLDPGSDDTGSPRSTDWAGISFGKSVQNAFVNSSEGMGILFRSDGRIQSFDGSKALYDGSGDVTIPTNGTFHVRIEAASEGFGGFATTVKLFVNGTQARLDNKSLEHVVTGGFNNNYITFMGLAAEGNQWTHLLDNFEISASGCVDFLTHQADGKQGDVITGTVQVPPSFVTSGSGSVTVTAVNPGVATLEGAVNNQLTLDFVSGGILTNVFQIDVVGGGVAQFVLSNTKGACVGQPLVIRASRAFVANPSFEKNYNATWPHVSSIDNWTGGTGVNDNLADASGPFFDNGTNPDQNRVAFQQGSGSLSQTISGLNPDKQYWLQFFYNARNASVGTSLEIDSFFNGAQLDAIPNVTAVGASKSFNFRNLPFTPGVDTGDISFQNQVSGDVTSLFDGVTIVQRDDNNVVVMNPSFEASGIVSAPGTLTKIAGWTGTGVVGVNFGGAGPYADNGVTPDQDNVAFIQDAGSLKQTLRGLIAGEKYTLTFGYNAPVGGASHLQVTADGATVIDTDVAPVGGSAAYHAASATFTAGNASVVLTFSQTKVGQTVLLDDVRVIGKVSEMPCLDLSPETLQVNIGLTTTIQVVIPPELIATAPAMLKFASADTTVAKLVGADASGNVSLTFNVGDSTTNTLTVLGVARGSTTVFAVSSAGLCVNNNVGVSVVSALVANPSFEAESLPGIGLGPITGWSTTGGSPGINDSTQPFADNGFIPDRKQVAKFSSSGVADQSNSLYQDINSLTAGKHYWLQFWFNVRNCCDNPTIDLSVQFAGTEVGSYLGILPVGGTNSYYFGQIEFTPTQSSGRLEFVTHTVGDATFLLDSVSIVQRDAGQIVVENPSFEASGITPTPGYIQPNHIGGWVGVGQYGIAVSGVGPFADNGTNPDQDNVAFLQGQSSLSQTLEGLTAGQNYTLKFAVNSRSGNAPHVRASVDGAAILDSDITAVGTNNPYTVKSAVFTAAGASAVLTLEQTVAGDETLLLDNVTVVPGGTVNPKLTIVRGANNTVQISWLTATGFTLQSSASLTGTWGDSGLTIQTQGSQSVATATPSVATQFYRLIKK